MIMYTHIVTKQTFIKQKYWYQLHRAHPLAEADMVKLTRDKWVQMINIELNGTRQQKNIVLRSFLAYLGPHKCALLRKYWLWTQ